MTLLSKLLVLASLLGALAFETWQARFSYPYLPTLTALAVIAGAAGSRYRPRHAAAAILIVAYWFPVLFVAATSRPFVPSFFVIWSGALAGLVAGDREALTWSYPSRWRFALVLWALAVALGWPLVAFREVDFQSLALVERYHVSNTGIGGSPTMVVAWISDVALLHLLGLLWFDWLFRRAWSLSLGEVELWIARPLAIGAVAGAALAVYQGAVDLGFRSGGLWPSMGRAAGPLLDANASGMIAALWSTGLLAFAGNRRARMLGFAGALLCWAGLWMTGSRTALLGGFIALAPVGLAVIRSAGGFRARRRELLAAGAAVVIAIGIVLALPSKGPLDRLRYMPTFAGDEGVDWLVREFWDRSSYGGAAAIMIGNHPTVGIGLGLFHLMGADYIRVHLHEVPPDNAQNWWRHNLVEMGVVGAAGLLIWSALFVAFLARTAGEGGRRVPAAALKGALVAIGLASLMGMPAQSLPVALTFWTFAFWYTRLVDREAATPSAGLGLLAWAAIVVVIAGYLGLTVTEARRSLRPPLRAASGDWPYVYGMYDPPERSTDGVTLISEQHGAAVIAVGGPIMMLNVRADHPDLAQRPVRAVVKVNGQTVVDMKLAATAPVVRKIEIGSGRHAVIEADVDRTWRSGHIEAEREIGLTISWKFLLNQTDAARGSAPLESDDRVIEIREQTLVQAVHVGVDGLRQAGQLPRQVGGRGALQAPGLGDRRSKMNVHAFESGGDDKELEGLGMERPHVSDVADVALEKRDPARGVDRLEHDNPARAHLREGRVEQADEIVRLAVLDHLQRR